MIKAVNIVDKAIKILSEDSELSKKFQHDLDSFSQNKVKWNKDKIRVGVIGVTSSGKSTLINAILGDSFLTMAVKPSSSQLVCCSKNEKKQAIVYFENRKTEILKGENLTSSNIKKYSDENFNTKNKENVVEIELSTPKFAFGDDILLIDSPGLDAYGLQVHEELTLKQLLPTIDVCIFVTTLKTNSDDKMRSILNNISEYKCPMIVVQNMLDSLKPSLDGTKNVQQVADEHRKRVERIINNSKIENKNSVKIVQMSAIRALQGRESNDKELMLKSQYKEFIDTVVNTIDKERPVIEEQRIRSIINRLKKIVNQIDEAIKLEGSFENLSFEYEGLDKEINNKLDCIHNKLKELILLLSLDYSILTKNFEKISDLKNGKKSIFSKFKNYTDKDIENVKNNVKMCEEGIINEIRNFNKYITNVAEKLNIPKRDIVSFNGLASMPELKLKKQIKYEDKFVKKTGFGSGIARFFGDLFNTDWGYEIKKVPVEVVDNVKTKQEIKDYIKYAREIYVKQIDLWERKNKALINQLLEQYENRLSAFQEKKGKAIQVNKLKDTKVNLDKLISSVNFTYKNLENNIVKSTTTNMKIKLEKVRVNKIAYSLAKIADKVLTNISIKTLELVLKKYNVYERRTIIIGWDVSCIISFFKRFFGIFLSEEELKNLEKYKNIKINNCLIYYNPLKEEIERLMLENEFNNIYILTNTTQYGSALTQITQSGIFNKIRKEDFIGFVIQDFTEIINGKGVCEAIENMISLPKKIEVSNKNIILINHENPIYNLAAIECQINNSETLKNETIILGRLQRGFNYLINKEVEEILAQIIRTI